MVNTVIAITALMTEALDLSTEGLQCPLLPGMGGGLTARAKAPPRTRGSRKASSGDGVGELNAGLTLVHVRVQHEFHFELIQFMALESFLKDPRPKDRLVLREDGGAFGLDPRVTPDAPLVSGFLLRLLNSFTSILCGAKNTH
ncbi:unnamed protein product [Phytophthora fragariaefolia]|uniref:Unnamed protein product n=1 Tax=Phytophthora fragariaefolia TaxID=1490495 RepID=A0A9W6X5C3_9STRA|nr:unnamed protein product [Phytophthora fragariaefolia]